MRKIHADLYRSHDDEGCKGCLLQKVYLGTEVDAHIAALQAQHAQALAENDLEIAQLRARLNGPANVPFGTRYPLAD